MNAEYVQFLLDSGKSRTRVASDLGVHHTTLQRFIERNDIEVYKAFDEKTYSAPIPDIEKCFYINEDFKVSADSQRLSELSILCGTSVGTLKTAVKDFINALELDALDTFVSSLDFDEINNEEITKRRHIVNYIYKHCGSFENFRDMFGISIELVKYSSNQLRSWFIHEGLEFENLLGKTLEVTPNIELKEKPYINGCMPDFVIDGRWVDAKLSKSTALSPADDTIPKYLENTDHLTIIYAYDDGADTSEVEEIYNVDFVHVSEYYNQMGAEAVKEFEDLIERVGVLKGESI